jgi:7,8-dihydro-6-hydroxymethylpterin-pyrophosphokinase
MGAGHPIHRPRAIDLDIIFFDDAVVDTRSKEEQNRLDNLV